MSLAHVDPHEVNRTRRVTTTKRPLYATQLNLGSSAACTQSQPGLPIVIIRRCHGQRAVPLVLHI